MSSSTTVASCSSVSMHDILSSVSDDGCINVEEDTESIDTRDDTNDKEEEVKDDASYDMDMTDDIIDATESETFDDIDVIEEEQLYSAHNAVNQRFVR